MSTPSGVDAAFLQRFTDAWNAHDVDLLMSFMTPQDCVFESSSGPEKNGTRFVGPEAVRKAYAGIFDVFADARWEESSHFVLGERGASEWTFRGTAADGRKTEVRGCDLFVFRDGRILVKDSYRKSVTKPQ